MSIIDLVQQSLQGNETIFAYQILEKNKSTYTKMVVHKSQKAVYFSKGKHAGKFGPGKDTLSTKNLPFIRHFFELLSGGRNPVTAEIWFVNKTQSFNIDWSITRMGIQETVYNTGKPMVANGLCSFRITDKERFLLKLVGSRNIFEQYDLTDQYLGEFSTKTKSTILQFRLSEQVGLKKNSACLDQIAEHQKTVMLPYWEQLGLSLTQFHVTTIETDSSSKSCRKVLCAISRQSNQSIVSYTWQQEQALEIDRVIMEGTSDNNSGMMGALFATNLMGGLTGGGGLLEPPLNQSKIGGSGMIPSYKTAPITSPVREIHCFNCSQKLARGLCFCPHSENGYDACPICGA